jgi:predicted transposase YdaD
VKKCRIAGKYKRDRLVKTDSQNQAIIELVSTVMVYKFPELSREIIDAMFTVSELKQTRVYRDAMNEGRAEEAFALVMRQLIHRVGVVPSVTETRISGLSLSQMENLGEALLDFSGLEDLEAWLRSHSISEGESNSEQP